MRGTVFVLSFAATCFGAQASSFIAPVGQPPATPSIVSLGEPAVAVSDDKVAAIPAQPARKSSEPRFSPMVIRGGIVGGLSAEPMPTIAPATAQADRAPDRGQIQPAPPPSASQDRQAASAAPARQPR